jgi:putative phosphoesterase
MRIGVISDTHITSATLTVAADAKRALAGVDLILHAGDLVILSVLKELEEIAPVTAVRGNMDPKEVAQALPARLVVEADGFRIGLMHGHGAPEGLIDLMTREFAEDNADAVVFGHSHHPLVEKRGDILFLNPGSPSGRGFSPYRSVGILETGAEITGRIVRL